jgi:hypothetical protein
MLTVFYISPTQEGNGSRAAAPPPRKLNLKNTDFVDTMISKSVRYLRFSLNQPPKSADD